MRKDETGSSCPETLGEYYDLCAALGGVECKACTFLKGKIDSHEKGREELVLAADSQMRMLLFSMLTSV